MSDVSNARMDYPHVPRYILEMLDFYVGPAVAQPHIKEGKRALLAAALILTGARVDSDDMMFIPDTPASPTKGLLIGKKVVYLNNLNRYFKEISE